MTSPRLSVIVAMARNRTIGAKNRMPWHLPADLRRFRAITMGYPIIMGRRTHQAIGRVLPGRANIVVSRDSAFRAPGCTVVTSVDAALATADADRVFVIGGAQLYSAVLDRAHRLYVTEIDAEIPGDTFFPEIDWASWCEVSREAFPADDRNPFGFAFVVYERPTSR
jgi:dihydrofolate reductase